MGKDLTIESAADYAPKPGDADYVKKSDVPWLRRFAAAGGKVVISGNTRMKKVPHERLALIESGFVVVFFESQWNQWKFFRKCALLLNWWPVIARQIRTAKPGSFWHIPSTWEEGKKLRAVSNEDPSLLRIERRAVASTKRKRRAKPKKVEPRPADLVDLMAPGAKQNGKKDKT